MPRRTMAPKRGIARKVATEPKVRLRLSKLAYNPKTGQVEADRKLIRLPNAIWRRLDRKSDRVRKARNLLIYEYIVAGLNAPDREAA